MAGCGSRPTKAVGCSASPLPLLTTDGLVRRDRRRLHARAAWALEAAAGERTDDVAGLLGHHYALGGEPERAAHYLEVTGDHAAAAFANEEAIASYRCGLELLSSTTGDMTAQLVSRQIEALMLPVVIAEQ
jgi:predicted ATPase